MKNFLSLISGTSDSREEILNVGLKYLLEFGKNWMQPINRRLSKRFPHLTDAELEEFNRICEQVRNSSLNYMSEVLQFISDQQQGTTEKELKSKLTEWIKDQFPWVSRSNIKRIHSQGLYYGWKDGLTQFVK